MIKDMKRDEAFKLERQKDKEGQKDRGERREGGREREKRERDTPFSSPFFKNRVSYTMIDHKT